MKCKKQPAFLDGRPTPIQDVWEVHLKPQVWLRIQTAAKTHHKTYSTVTRFCVLELAERSHLRNRGSIQKILNIEGSREDSVAEVNHRHLVCFYGEDMLLVRMAALRLGVTVSAFIRLALHIYLRYFATDFHSCRRVTAEMLFWKGIKRWRSIPITAINELSLPAIRSFAFISFLPHERWDYP